MYFHELDLSNPALQVSGVDADTLARIAALVTKLTTVVDDHGVVHRRSSQHYRGLDLSLKIAKHVSEAHYHKRLGDVLNNPVERLRTMESQIMRRTELIGLLLHYHERSVQDHEALVALMEEVTKLQPLLAGLSHTDPLVGFCVGLSSLVRLHPAPFDLRHQLRESSDLTLAYALESVNLVFDVFKTGIGPFETYHSLSFHPIRVRNPSAAQVELITAVEAARQMERSFGNIRQVNGWVASESNRQQFAQRLEQASMPPELLPECQRGSSVESVLSWQQDAEAASLAHRQHMRMWHPVFDAVRARLTQALSAACAELDPPRYQWGLVRAFDTEEGLNLYKAMINCIHARYELQKLDEMDAAFRKLESDQLCLLDHQAYIAMSMDAGRSRSLPSTAAPKSELR